MGMHGAVQVASPTCPHHLKAQVDLEPLSPGGAPENPTTGSLELENCSHPICLPAQIAHSCSYPPCLPTPTFRFLRFTSSQASPREGSTSSPVAAETDPTSDPDFLPYAQDEVISLFTKPILLSSSLCPSPNSGEDRRQNPQLLSLEPSLCQ